VLFRSHEGRWEPESLFTASVLFASIIRFLSFSTISMLSFKNIELNNTGTDDPAGGNTSWSTTQHDEFYTRVTVTLFSVGDFVFLTAYMMLVVLWAETFQRTRRHFFSVAALKRRMLSVYLGGVVFLYFMLILLYSLFLFSAKDSPRMLDAIYILLGLVDLLVPLALLFTWGCMSFIFSGFPIRSQQAKRRWGHINKLVALWSFGRIVWGIASIISMYYDWTVNTGAWQFASGLVTVTLVAEILPFMIMPSFSVTAARPSMLPTDEEDTAGDWVPPEVPGAAPKP